MKLPELPPGYRWKVTYNDTYDIQKVTARIKRFGLTRAVGSWYPDITNMRDAAERAVSEAYDKFTTSKRQQRIKLAAIIGDGR